MVVKKRASNIQEARKIGKRGNKRPAMDFGDCAGKIARGYMPELPN
jgi:hypothetical protein